MLRTGLLAVLVIGCSSESPLGGGADAGNGVPDASAPSADARVPALTEIIGGPAAVGTAPRSAFGGLVAAAGDGDRVYVVESRRDVEAGPFGLPWRSRFRVAAYDGVSEAWSFGAPADDKIGDVVVHPSGDVTISVEHFAGESDGYELVRLNRGGDVVGRTTLVAPATIPEGDYGANDPRPLFRMKADLADATTAGWVRLLPDGEGLAVAFLSYVAAPPTDFRSRRLAIGLETMDWRDAQYVERWGRVVDGMHAAEPVAWAYDELRWRDQAVRPFLARDESTGDLLVGRAWNSLRCTANRLTFAEFTLGDCIMGAVGGVEVEWLPLAVTRFDRNGARRGTRVLAPDADAAEQVGFALAARGGELAVAGAVVRTLADGITKRTYPDANGYVDYDGYVAIYDGEGKPVRHHDFDHGRGDVLVALRWSDAGIVAVGASEWDRWQGGMSISAGASPLLAWLAPDGGDARLRVVPLGDGTRHFNLHDVIVTGDAILGFGFSDAPMTHSGDGGGNAARSFGPLRVELTSPAR